RLREVPEHEPAIGVVLLAEQPEAVRGRDRAVEGPAGILDSALPGEHLGEPEGAGDERPLLAPESVIAVVATEQPIPVEPLANRIGGADHPLVVVGDEIDGGEAKQRRVEPVLAERRNEDPALSVVAVVLDRRPDL